MTVNISRSCNAELKKGASDGTVRKTVTDRGGVVEATSTFDHMHATGFGPHPPWPGPTNTGDGTELEVLHGTVRGT